MYYNLNDYELHSYLWSTPKETLPLKKDKKTKDVG